MFLHRFLIVGAFVGACTDADPGRNGGHGGADDPGTYAAECAMACAPEYACEEEDPAECQAACVNATEGLAPSCAQCIAETSGWAGIRCPMLCSNCCPCPFRPTEDSCPACSGSCSPADEQCTGFEIGEPTSSACATACKP